MTVVAVSDGRVEAAPGVSLAVRTHRPAAGEPTTGPPVLLVHGLASNARLWDGVAADLAGRGFYVVAVDQRGHGRSDRPDDGYDFATLTADLVAVLDAQGWDAATPPVVAGQSWGGNVVVELAARHPGRVAGLVLVDGGTIELQGRFADWPTCEVALEPPDMTGTPFEDFEAMIRRSHPDWPEEGIEGTLANLERLPDGTARARLPLTHHMTIVSNLWDHHPSQRWASLDLPVVVLAAGDPSGRSGRSDAAKRDEVERAVRTLPQGRAVWIDGDHDLHAQYPDRVADLIAGLAPATLAAGGR
jgi:pimeloyl-ACP methyl ester carboxylesterase